MYEIEDTPYKARVMAIKARITQIEARLEYDKNQFERNKKLNDKNIVSASVFEDFKREYTTTKAMLMEEKANLLNAENDLSYTKIYSPLTGKIGFTQFDEGSLVTPASGKLTDVQAVSPIYVNFSVGENFYRRVFGGLNNLMSISRSLRKMIGKNISNAWKKRLAVIGDY